MSPRNERGVALMLVFWLIIVLGVMAAALVAATREESAVVVNLRARARARAAAMSGVAYATAELRRTARETSAPRELAFLYARLRRRLADAGELTLATTRFQVTVLNLNARIDLNAADEPTLHGLFAQFVPPAEADAAVAALVDWRDADDRPRSGGAEAEEYAAAGSPFRPANRPLRSVEELSRVHGVSTALAAHVAPWVTVWSDGAIDINAAPEPVLAALPGVGANLAQAFAAHRATNGLFQTFGEAVAFLSRGGTGGTGLVGVRATTVPSRLLIVSRGWEPGHALTHEVQVAIELRRLAAGRAPEVLVRGWTERDR